LGFQPTRWRTGNWVFQAVRRTQPTLVMLIFAAGMATNPVGLHGQISIENGPSSGIDQSKGLDQMHRHILMRQVNIARQKDMVSHAVKLVQLANELDAEVRAAGESPLSATQLDKIGKIQKLAHSVKDKMQFAALPH
jgi:hypothetical protein